MLFSPFLYIASIHVPSVSVLWYPFLFSSFVGCHVSVSPILSLESCPLSFFATRSYFRTISISFFVALPQSKLCPLFFLNQMSQYCIFSSPFSLEQLLFLSPSFLFIFLQVSVRRGFTFSQDRQPVERGLLADRSTVSVMKTTRQMSRGKSSMSETLPFYGPCLKFKKPCFLHLNCTQKQQVLFK